MKEITLYTDGACSKNPGPGGWAAILCYKGNEKELCGFAAETTNNRMELTGVLKGLIALKEPCKVHVFTDSAYIHNAFNKGWVIAWQNNGWKKHDKKPVENQDIWKQIINQSKQHKIIWHKVKGHSDNEKNNRCDALARREIKNGVGKSKTAK